MLPRFPLALLACLPTIVALGAVPDDGLIPPASAIKADRPRLLVRPQTTPFAISLEQLAALPRDAEFQRMLDQLQAQDHAAAQAMVWLLTKDASAADRAVRRMRAYRYPGEVDTFHIFGHLTEFGLAYDWLYDYPGFTAEIKAEIRANLAPLAEQAIRVTNDHMFHNYIWMSAGGVALWAMATAGEDAAADRLFEQIRQRFNRGLYPAWRYLDGLPSEPMGYWSLYVFTPGVWTLLAAQSAFETDLVGTVRTQHGDWLDRHFENLIHSTLPNMRYIPWGDLQGGPNGGVTHEMAGVIDGATWALRSPHGARFSRWLARQTRPGAILRRNGHFLHAVRPAAAARAGRPAAQFPGRQSAQRALHRAERMGRRRDRGGIPLHRSLRRSPPLRPGQLHDLAERTAGRRSAGLPQGPRPAAADRAPQHPAAGRPPAAARAWAMVRDRRGFSEEPARRQETGDRRHPVLARRRSLGRRSPGNSLKPTTRACWKAACASCCSSARTR